VQLHDDETHLLDRGTDRVDLGEQAVAGLAICRFVPLRYVSDSPLADPELSRDLDLGDVLCKQFPNSLSGLSAVQRVQHPLDTANLTLDSPEPRASFLC
jgi:hypothetical protein